MLFTVVKQEAHDDVITAYNYYEEQQPGLGVAADAFLPFSSAAVLNGVASYQPFAESDQFKFIGYNKSLEQTTIDFSVSFAVGGIGARLGEGIPSVSGAFQKNVVEVGTGTPTSFAQEIANTLINQKMTTQK